MGVPGCPEFAAWIASMARVRIVLMQSSSSGCLWDLMLGLLSIGTVMIYLLGAAVAPLAAPAASKMFTHSRLRRAISLIATSRAIRPSVPFPLNQHTSARRSG